MWSKSIALFLLLSVTLSSQESRPAPNKKADGWDLSKIDVSMHEAVRCIERCDYAAARTLLKELEKTAKKDKADNEVRKKLHFALNLAGELEAAQEIANKPEISHKDLETARALCTQNRRHVTFERFLEAEDTVRHKLGILTLKDFELPVSAYPPIEGALEFFRPNPYVEGIAVPPGCTWAENCVFQGRFAYHYRDSLADKNLVSVFPIVAKKDSWAKYKFLCFAAKLDDPKSAALKVTCITRQYSRDGWQLNCGSWTGWKQHRLEFKKHGSRTTRDTEINWEIVYSLEFSVEGGISDLFLDDVHLCE